MEWVSLMKITITTKRRISLLGSQALKLMSQGQIAVIGEDLQFFWQILNLQHGGKKSKFALTRAKSPMP